jgi:hypothetical protein
VTWKEVYRRFCVTTSIAFVWTEPSVKPIASSCLQLLSQVWLCEEVLIKLISSVESLAGYTKREGILCRIVIAWLYCIFIGQHRKTAAFGRRSLSSMRLWVCEETNKLCLCYHAFGQKRIDETQTFSIMVCLMVASKSCISVPIMFAPDLASV